DLRCQILVHDQVAAVCLSVEADVVDPDPSQLPRLNWAAGVPARAEVGGADRLNRRGGCCGRRGRRGGRRGGGAGRGGRRTRGRGGGRRRPALHQNGSGYCQRRTPPTATLGATASHHCTLPETVNN